MNASGSSSPGPRTDAEFLDQLDDLIRAAVDNGVDVEGGWDLRGEGESGLSVEIFRVRSD